ncbi:pterocarpan synthase 1-like [Salvia miltiorrhiza]|uniref:pterocarpan synthase 1-like n=1 Tax=Salvia miltiorrhiza TaxID=226208 RepID=UPI0025ABA880|nr:pterocarpan synthase 1-like [Salvia miltiorrhiza]
MKKSMIVVILWSSILCKAMAGSSPLENPKAVEKWVETLIKSNKQEKLSKLHFYFHRLGGGASSPSAVVVAKANATMPNSFGLTVIRDDPLTVGPEMSSAHIGYAQGMSATVSLEEVVLVDYFTLSFGDGSSLAVVGSNAIFHEYRELPIVGGTGAFRLARGVVTFQTYFFNATTRDASIQADAVVFHY